VPGIVAVMQIVKQGYPDPTAFDRKHHHLRSRQRPRQSALVYGGRAVEARLARTIALEELRSARRQAAQGHGAVAPGNRLSITPVEAAHWKFILSLE